MIQVQTNHDHHCDHEMAFCQECDVAYCRKCKKEWGSNTSNLTPITLYPLGPEPYYTGTPPRPGLGWITTSDAGTTVASFTCTSQHS